MAATTSSDLRKAAKLLDRARALGRKQHIIRERALALINGVNKRLTR